MTTKYPKGSYIVREGRRRKVLAELEDLRFISYRDDENEQWEKCVEGQVTTVFELERWGWKEEKQNLPDTANFTVHCTACKKEEEAKVEPWKPQKNNEYFYFESNNVYRSVWGNAYIDRTRAYLGVYPTKEAAEAAFRICQEALRKAGMMK